MDASHDVRALRRDLDAASDRNMLQQRELDRLRALLAESRAEHQVQVEALMKSVAVAETNSAKAEAQLSIAKERQEKAEQQARDAWAAHEAQAAKFKDIRAEVATRMDSLVSALHQRDEELHKAQYQASDASRLRERVAQLEKMISSRDDALADLTARFGELRATNDKLALELVTVASTARAESMARSASVVPQAYMQAAASPAPPPPPPPPPIPQTDPHVLETAHIVTQCREWTQETDRTIVSLEDLVESQFVALQDLRLVIERGVANVNTDSLGSAAANLDRHRLAELRRTEQRRLEQQLAAVSDTASTAALIKASMANAKFNFNKLRHTMQEIADYIASLRQYVDRYCGVVGIPTMFSKWDAFAKSRPEPLPMPSTAQQGGSNGLVPQSPAGQAPGTPPFVGTAPASPLHAFQTEQYTAEIAELTKRLRKAEATVDEYSEKLRVARMQSDNERSALMEDHRKVVNQMRTAAAEERRDLLREIDEAKVALTASRRESDDTLQSERRQHAAELQERDRERAAIVAELQSRIVTLEAEVEQAVAAKLRDAAALDEAKMKRKAMKAELIQVHEECARLTQAVGELNADIVEAHKNIDRLEAELEASKSALEFEIRQQEESQRLEVGGGFRDWKRNAAHVAAAAEAARMGMTARVAPIGAAPSVAGGDAVAGRIGALPRPGSRSASNMSSTAVFVQRPPPHRGGSLRPAGR